MKKVLSLMLAAAMLLSVSVFCVSAEKTEFPFSLTTYMDMTVTFDHVPQRVIAANTNAADQLYAMGLQDKIIGVCYKNSTINPEYQEMYDAASRDCPESSHPGAAGGSRA